MRSGRTGLASWLMPFTAITGTCGGSFTSSMDARPECRTRLHGGQRMRNPVISASRAGSSYNHISSQTIYFPAGLTSSHALHVFFALPGRRIECLAKPWISAQGG
jgi:hypothetical protein